MITIASILKYKLMYKHNSFTWIRSIWYDSAYIYIDQSIYKNAKVYSLVVHSIVNTIWFEIQLHYSWLKAKSVTRMLPKKDPNPLCNPISDFF